MSVLSALAVLWLLSPCSCFLGCRINTLQEEVRGSGWQWRSECRGLKELHQPQSLLGIPFVSPEEIKLQVNSHLLNYTLIGMAMLKGGTHVPAFHFEKGETLCCFPLHQRNVGETTPSPSVQSHLPEGGEAVEPTFSLGSPSVILSSRGVHTKRAGISPAAWIMVFRA